MSKNPFLLIPVLAFFLFVNVCLASEKTSLQTAQDEIMSLIDAKDFKAAQSAIDKMAADFKDDKLLPRRLWEDANRYDKAGAFEYARSLSELVAADYPFDSYASSYASLLAARLDIYEQIDSGDYTGADSAVEKMMTDFAGHNQLARRIWEVANRYDKVEAFDRSKQLCERVIADYPDDIYAGYAALQSAKLGTFELINTGRYEEAKKAASAIVKDFTGHKQHARRLWEIANRFDKFKAFNYSKELCEQIVAGCPGDEYSSYAALQLARLNVYELIDAKKLPEAKEAVTKIMEDFSGHKQLTRRLYEIAQQYAKKGAHQYAGELHSLVASNWPEDKYGVRSAVQHKKLEAYAQIDANDLHGVKETILQMKTEFADSSILYAQLDSIGEKYDRVGRADEARKIFQEIIEKFPPDGNPAVLAQTKGRMKKYELFSAIESGNDIAVDVIVNQLDNLSGDANERPDEFIYILTGECNYRGTEARVQGNIGLATYYFAASIELAEKLFTQYPDSPRTACACFVAAAQLAQEFSDYAGAVEHFQKVADNWPGYEYADWAQLKVGENLEAMVNIGGLEAEAGRPLIRAAYQKAIENYPKSKYIGLAQQKLEEYK